MPAFDLRGIKIAEYKHAAGVVSHGEVIGVGDAMNCNLELRYAEGRLYAESTLAEYMKKATGGTISIGVKYIKEDAQKLMYGTTPKTRTVDSVSVDSLVTSATDVAKYVGVAFYAPDMVDSVEKYTCVFVRKALFGPPGLSYQTMGDSVTFQTPTTTGEFLADDSEDKILMEVAICDTLEAAKAWTEAVFAA